MLAIVLDGGPSLGSSNIESTFRVSEWLLAVTLSQTIKLYQCVAPPSRQKKLIQC